IEENYVGLQISRLFDGVASVRCLATNLPFRSRYKNRAHTPPDEFMVVHNQYSHKPHTPLQSAVARGTFAAVIEQRGRNAVTFVCWRTFIEVGQQSTQFAKTAIPVSP